tara:strand:+ start:141 stop:356 length:216 start_codon:yes stop_codon:yes gene_type:complete
VVPIASLKRRFDHADTRDAKKLVRHTRWRAADPIGDRQRHTVTTLAQLDYRSVEMSNKTHGIECEEDFHFG